MAALLPRGPVAAIPSLAAVPRQAEMPDRALGHLPGRQARVVDPQVIRTPVELSARVELAPRVHVEQPSPGRRHVTRGGFLGQTRRALIALQPLGLVCLELKEQHAGAPLTERPRVLIHQGLVFGQVEGPDKGEDQAGQVAGGDLLETWRRIPPWRRRNAGVPYSK
jgi:hypothetical protein